MWGGTDDLVVILKTTPAVLTTLVRGIDDERARRTPGSGEWSIVGVVAHLADADEKAIERVTRMTTEDEPTIEGYDQVALAEARGNAEMKLSEVLPRFVQLRTDRVALLQRLADADWQRTGRHNQEGLMTVEQLTLHMCRHDAIHLEQISRLITG